MGKIISAGMMDLTDLIKKPKYVCEHYGVKKEDNEKIHADMVRDFLILKSQIKILDKYFKDCDAETRAKILCFAAALHAYDEIKDFR